MTYVEAKFGLRIRDSKPSDTGARGHSDPTDVDAVNSLSSVKGKGSSSSAMGGAVNHIFNETSLQRTQEHRQQSSGKGKQSKSWSKSEGKGRSKENKGKSKGKIQRNQKCEPRCQRLTQGQNIGNWSLRS